jgi:hypothetical protein
VTREQLAHILRAASAIAGERDVLVIGSQSVLGTFGEQQLPFEATSSMEADVAFFDDPGDIKADRVDGAIGELSGFHETFGFYAQGVSVTTAVLPDGWRDRVVSFERPLHPVRCPGGIRRPNASQQRMGQQRQRAQLKGAAIARTEGGAYIRMGLLISVRGWRTATQRDARGSRT